MANKKNWARRNKKSNNWSVISRIKKAKKATQNRLDFQDENHSNINVASPVTSAHLETCFVDVTIETPNNEVNITNREDSLPLPQENYFACLSDDENPLLCAADTVDERIAYTEHSHEDSDGSEDCDGSDNSGDDSVDDGSDGESEQETQVSSGDECMSTDADEENVVTSEELNGRRLFEAGHFFEELKRIGRHSRGCSFENMEIIAETVRGLNSIFKFRCAKCGVHRKIETCPKRRNAMSCNEEAVLGITSIGSGYSHLKELFTNLNVPVMSSSTYDKIQKNQQSDWLSAASESTLDALYEEIEIAKALGMVDSDGNALIVVICDGGWGKRSYGKAFNSLSGCAVLIGLRTKKVLFYGTRNKYCHTCKIAESRFMPVKQHDCNINYKGPSSGMESDIITEGFKLCQEHKARFYQLIADGDSNTYKNLRDIRIYRNPDVFIEKFECVNHLHRNFRSKFSNLSTLAKFNCDLRKHIKPKKGNDISKGVKAASKYWRETNLSIYEQIKNLEDDIMNSPRHYFGVHDKCKKYFCSHTTTQDAIANLQLLKDDGIYYEVLNLCQHYFAGNAKSLLKNYTNNAAEEFNSVVAKYIGGKRINYSLGRSYSARVAAAVVQYNSGGHASSYFRKHKLGQLDNSRIETLENQRKRKLIANDIARQAKPNRRIERRERDKTNSAAFLHGDGCEDIDKEPPIFEQAKEVFMKKLKNNQRNSGTIEKETHGGRFNDRWQQIRQDLLPSPFFSKIVKTQQRRTYKNILEELLYKRSEFGNSAHIKHQRLVERDAFSAFETIFNEHNLQECGISIDAELSYLCTSPQKLWGKHHVLMVKCPIKQYGKRFEDVIHTLPFWKKEGGSYGLNKNHEWFIEIQSELHITQRKFGFVMVWLGEFNDQTQYRIVEIPKDDAFFEKIIKPKLVYFFENVMVKELVDSRKERRMKLREYDPETRTFI